MPNLTIKDIARISGCSVSTISRVINDRPDVRPETKEHVLKVMREAGFVPNTNARQLKIQQSRSVVSVSYTHLDVYKRQVYDKVSEFYAVHGSLHSQTRRKRKIRTLLQSEIGSDFSCLVEAMGVEPMSEKSSAQVSPGAGDLQHSRRVTPIVRLTLW